MGENDPHRNSRKKDVDMYCIRLTCGHTIRSRNQPFRPSTTYHCTMNLGCGYALNWVSWTNGGDTWDNVKQ